MEAPPDVARGRVISDLGSDFLGLDVEVSIYVSLNMHSGASRCLMYCAEDVVQDCCEPRGAYGEIGQEDRLGISGYPDVVKSLWAVELSWFSCGKERSTVFSRTWGRVDGDKALLWKPKPRIRLGFSSLHIMYEVFTTSLKGNSPTD